MKSYTIHEAKTNFSKLLKAVALGEKLAIKRNKELIAFLVPATKNKAHLNKPKVGQLTSDPVETSADAFEPLTLEEMKTWGL